MEPEITRIIDELGRVIVPTELREELGWSLRDVIEFYREGDTIVMKRAAMANEQ